MLNKQQKIEAIWWIRGELSFWIDKQTKKKPGRWFGWVKEVERFLNEKEVELEGK